MIDPQPAEFDAALRKDFLPFSQKVFQEVGSGNFDPSWHHEAIAHRLNLCAAGKTKRLIINIQPRSLKSILVSVAWPAFLLGHNPKHQFLCVSYAESVALDNARAFRKTVESDWYKRLFPTRLVSPGSLEQLQTTAGGQRLSVGLGGSLTGRGGNFIILDDPMKPSEAESETERENVKRYFDGTLYSRLNSKKDDVIIMIMQRLHEDDLTGHLLSQGGWDHLKLPSIATELERIPILDGKFHERQPGDLLQPLREPKFVLDESLRRMGSRAFEAQFQQDPTPAAGLMIKREWLRYYDNLPGANA